LTLKEAREAWRTNRAVDCPFCRKEIEDTEDIMLYRDEVYHYECVYKLIKKQRKGGE